MKNYSDSIDGIALLELCTLVLSGVVGASNMPHHAYSFEFVVWYNTSSVSVGGFGSVMQ